MAALAARRLRSAAAVRSPVAPLRPREEDRPADRTGASPLSRRRPSARAARGVLRDPRRAALHHQHVPPLAVEAPMAAMDAHLAPAARLHEGDARPVRGEDLSHQLVVAATLGLVARARRAGPCPAPAPARCRAPRRASPRRPSRSRRGRRRMGPGSAQPTTAPSRSATSTSRPASISSAIFGASWVAV